MKKLILFPLAATLLLVGCSGPGSSTSNAGTSTSEESTIPVVSLDDEQKKEHLLSALGELPNELAKQDKLAISVDLKEYSTSLMIIDASYTVDTDEYFYAVRATADNDVRDLTAEVKATGLLATSFDDVKAEAHVNLASLSSTQTTVNPVTSMEEAQTISILNQEAHAYVDNGVAYMDLSGAEEIIELTGGDPSIGLKAYVDIETALGETIPTPLAAIARAYLAQYLEGIENAEIEFGNGFDLEVYADGSMKVLVEMPAASLMAVSQAVHSSPIDTGNLTASLTLTSKGLPTAVEVKMDATTSDAGLENYFATTLKEELKASSEGYDETSAYFGVATEETIDLSVSFAYDTTVSIPSGLGGEGWIDLNDTGSDTPSVNA